MASVLLPCLCVPNTVISEMTENMMDTSTKSEQKNFASMGFPNANGMEITENTIAVIALLETGFFVELSVLLMLAYSYCVLTLLSITS